jgi:hypothetical protein
MQRGATPIGRGARRACGPWGVRGVRGVRGIWALALVSIGCHWAGLPAVSAPDPATGSPRFREIRRHSAPAATQAVAVDGAHFYAIASQSIEKYEKSGGTRVASWAGPASGPIVHLNSGIVLDGALYCAHSNFPGIPMLSSIEIFDAETLEHRGSHSFGIFGGSATWIDRWDDHWWVAFAHYQGRGGEPGKGPSWTTLVKFDAQWRRVAGFAYPSPVVAGFAGRSNSGGAWGADGLLYITGHDAAEVTVLRLPVAGSFLEVVEILPAPIEGQGIAWDRHRPGVLYGLVKRTREVVVSILDRP